MLLFRYVCLALVAGLIPSSLQAQPVRVFILAGQSNMQGHAQVRTFEHLRMNASDERLRELMENADGTPRCVIMSGYRRLVVRRRNKLES